MALESALLVFDPQGQHIVFFRRVMGGFYVHFTALSRDATRFGFRLEFLYLNRPGDVPA